MNNRRRFLKTGSASALAALAAAPSIAQSNARYKAAIIGRTGGGDYGHGYEKVFTGIDNVEVVAVADENEEGGRAAAERAGAKRVYQDYRDMLEKETPDLVSIASRQPDCHKDMALAAIEAGAHIFMEKPMTESPAEADAIIQAAQAKGIKIAIAHTRRLMNVFQTIHALLKENAIGTILEMRVSGKQDSRAGGEDLIVLGTHDFDLMRWFFGDPLWCSASVWQAGRPVTIDDARLGREPILVAGDTIRASFAFKNNIACHWTSVKTDDHWNTRFSNRENWRFELYGTKGIIAYQSGLEAAYWPSPYPAHLDDSVKWEPLPKPKRISLDEYERNAARSLIRAIETGGEPFCSMIDGRWTIDMVASVYRSHLTGCQAPLPLKDRSHPLKRA